MESSILIIPWVLVLVSAIASQKTSEKSIWYMSLITYLGVGGYALYLLPDYFGTDKRLFVAWHLEHSILPVMLGLHMQALPLLLISFASIMTFVVYLFSAKALLTEQRIATYCLNINIFMATWISIILSASLLQVILGLAILSCLSYTMITQYHKQRGVKSAAERVVFLYRFADILLIFVLTGMFSIYNSFNINDVLAVVQNDHDAVILYAFTSIFALSVAIHCGLFLFHTGASDIAESATGMMTLISSTGMALFSVYMMTTFYPLLKQSYMIIDVLKWWVIVTLVWVAIRSLFQTHCRRIMADLSNIQLLLLMLAVLGDGEQFLYAQLFMYMASQFLLFGFSRALLYLTSNEFDVRQMGGLATRAPIISLLSITYVAFATGAIFVYAFGHIPTGFAPPDNSIGGTQYSISALIVFFNTLAIVRFVSYTMLGKCRMSERTSAYIKEPQTLVIAMLGVFTGILVFYAPLYQIVNPLLWTPDYNTLLDVIGFSILLALFVSFLFMPSKNNAGLTPNIIPNEPKWAHKVRQKTAQLGTFLWRRLERHIIVTRMHKNSNKILMHWQAKLSYEKTDTTVKHLYIPLIGTILIFVSAVIYGELF